MDGQPRCTAVQVRHTGQVRGPPQRDQPVRGDLPRPVDLAPYAQPVQGGESQLRRLGHVRVERVRQAVQPGAVGPEPPQERPPQGPAVTQDQRLAAGVGIGIGPHRPPVARQGVKGGDGRLRSLRGGHLGKGAVVTASGHGVHQIHPPQEQLGAKRIEGGGCLRRRIGADVATAPAAHAQACNMSVTRVQARREARVMGRVEDSVAPAQPRRAAAVLSPSRCEHPRTHEDRQIILNPES